jgi:hypothetical protein
MNGISSSLEFSAMFLEKDNFRNEYYHKSDTQGHNYLDSFPCRQKGHDSDLSYGSPLNVLINIFVPSAVAADVKVDEILEKICCVGEFKAQESIATIVKSIKGSELADLLSNKSHSDTDMYWGRLVRRMEPVQVDKGALYKVLFEFNSESAHWYYRLGAYNKFRDTTSSFCFGITLLMLNNFSQQSIASIKYPHVLQTWFQHEIFQPTAYFDSPLFRIVWSDHASNHQSASPPMVMCEDDSGTECRQDSIGASTNDALLSQALSSNESHQEFDNVSAEDSSVLSRIIASAPIFATQDDFPLSSWLLEMRHNIHTKFSSSSSSSLSLQDLEFQYEMPTVYKDATKTFLSLFNQLVPEKSMYVSSVEQSYSLDEKSISKSEQEDTFAEMRQEMVIAFLKNKLHVPIATEIAAIFAMVEIAKQHFASNPSADQNGSKTSGLSAEKLKREGEPNGSSAEEQTLRAADNSIEEDAVDKVSLKEFVALNSLYSEVTSGPEYSNSGDGSVSNTNKSVGGSKTALDVLTLIAEYFVQENKIIHPIEDSDSSKKRSASLDVSTNEETINESDSQPPAKQARHFV